MLAMAVQNIAANPLFERLTRREVWPDLRSCLRLAAAVALGGLTLIALAVWSDPLARHPVLGIPIPNLILLLNGGIRILSLPLLATLIVAKVIRAIEQGEFSLIQISRISNGEIVEGFVASALYRMRIAWTIAVGLALPTLAAIFYQDLRQMRRVYLCNQNTLACLGNARPEYAVFQLGVGIFAEIVDYAVYYGWVWLVSYGSVWLALRLRSIGTSTGALVLPLVALMLYLADSYSVVGLSLNPLPSAFPTFGYCGTGLVLPLLLLAMKDYAVGRVRSV